MAGKRGSSPTDQHVGNRIRMRRVMLKMSQADLAEQLGITFQQVHKYEKGTNRVGASRLQDIANILQVPVPFFFEDLLPNQPVAAAARSTVPTADIDQFIATTDGLNLAKSFMRIKSIKVRQQIVRLVTALNPLSLDTLN
jgi:transcriptional regulator with XRE-family HTH domain